ncbi:MAG: hypothetical protein GY847_29015 [Proteobacteria bacterium]|nr:hypothetical protein [Pseudomonadota bacterium]
MPIKRTAWQCEWGCGRYLLTRQYILEHEHRCYYNPTMKACKTCSNFSYHQKTVYNNYHNGDPGSTDWEVEVMGCSERDGELKKMTFRCVDWIEK